jgi:hypothetical protein
LRQCRVGILRFLSFPFKSMDQYFNWLHHRAAMVWRAQCYLDYSRLAHENVTFCSLSDNYLPFWFGRYVLTTHLVTPWTSWHHHLR